MQEPQLFEYAVIRIVPHVEREEFINAGVVLYCASQKFLKAMIHLREEKLAALCSKTDIAQLESYLAAFDNICNGLPGSGPIGKLPNAERFRWLTATRSTVLQTSKVHPGLTTDPGKTLEKLFAELVG